MIMIKESWEQVEDLSDVLRIVSENIGDEFAQKVEMIYKESLYDLENKLSDLEYEISDYNDIHDSLDFINEQLDLLEEYIDENYDSTDFMEGMKKAYNMIER